MGFVGDDAAARVRMARGQPRGRECGRKQGGREPLAAGRDLVPQRGLPSRLARQALEQLGDLESRALQLVIEPRRRLCAREPPGDFAVPIELALHAAPRPGDVALGGGGDAGEQRVRHAGERRHHHHRPRSPVRADDRRDALARVRIREGCAAELEHGGP